MTLNYPGPYGLRIFYTTTPTGFPAFTHKLEVNVRTIGTPAPGDDFATVDLQQHDGGAINVDAAAIAVVNSIKPLFHTLTDFTLWELWKYAPFSSDGTYITSKAIGTGGTNATAAIPAAQTILTFRSLEGGSIKMSLMETSIVPAAEQAFPTGTAAVNTLAAFVTSNATGFILARDTSRPVAAKGYFPGQNERMFKKRYRSG